jgi:GH24 family phage-related lysozyme (muramidase)
VSDVLSKPSKVSREGVLLIKSFEGFRPRATQRSDGRWVIGYGHTHSARDGATVSEADAELLMQYDLIPVVKAVGDKVTVPLNQHQFDALASFAFSIGVEQFATSDVVEKLNAGAGRQAAAALSRWSDDAAAQKPTRRRSAEYALFNAQPGAPVTLADLLAAPLPSPFETEQPTLAAVDGTLEEAVAPFPSQDIETSAQILAQGAAAPLVAANDLHAPLKSETPATEFTQADKSSVVLTAPGLSEATPDATDDTPTETVEPAFKPEQALSAREILARARAQRQGRGELITFLVMGGLGVLSLGVAMAAFRRGSVSDSGDTATVAWVLLLIAAACIGVSGYNLYRRWGRDDRV